jgi:hypothetical protein
MNELMRDLEEEKEIEESKESKNAEKSLSELSP